MPVAIWQVHESGGRWRDFPQHLNQATEEQFKDAPDACFQYVWADRGGTYWTYVIDFESMVQNRLSMDGAHAVGTRKIRRALLEQ